MFMSFLQAQLYRAGHVTSTMRLLHAQAQMKDGRKLSEYSLPEGAIISALFEPDVDINIEVIMGHQTQKFKVSNATSVMALKVQIAGIMRSGIIPKRLEMRQGDVALDDPMPLHFYDVKEESKLDVIKPYVRVRVENNHGNLICWRLTRNDTIKEVKVKLVASLNNISTEQLHLYKTGGNFDELDDDDTAVAKLQDQRWRQTVPADLQVDP